MTDVSQMVLYVSSEIVPANLLELSTQTSALRDAFFVTAMRSDDTIERCLITFVKLLSSKERIIDKADITLCEYAATMAHMAGELDLAKEILMRVPPQQITSYIKTLYNAIAIRKWSSEIFKQAIANTTENALNLWRVEKNALGI